MDLPNKMSQTNHYKEIKTASGPRNAKPLIEVCCGSAEDAIQAALGGADRAELCSNLFQGGLTPTPGTFATVRAHSSIPLMVMIRPREGGFYYTPSEYETALRDAEYFIAAGADGLVCGFLHEDGRVDVERTTEIIEIANGLPVTFHRAIDVVPDWKEALDALAEIGITRVLTSGQCPSVMYGLATIRAMREYAADRLIIMPGAGIRPDTVREVYEKTGCSEMHVAFTKAAYDRSTSNQHDIFYGGALYPPEDRYSIVDPDLISQAIEQLN